MQKPLETTEKRDLSLDFLEDLRHRFPSSFSLDRLKGLLQGGKLNEASKYVNQCLSNHPKSSPLHVINGFLYGEMARCTMDMNKASLVEEAYRSACKFDAVCWIYPSLLGEHYLQNKQYEKALECLSDALALKPKHPVLLYNMACASYQLGNLVLARHCINKCLQVCGNMATVQQAACLIFSACNEPDAAKEALHRYRELCKDPKKIAAIQQRMEDWSCTHANRFKAVSAKDVQVEPLGEHPGDSHGGEPKAPDPTEKLTVSLECCLLSVRELKNQSKGRNILDLLSVFGGKEKDSLISYNNENNLDNWKKNLTLSVSANLASYALNIANAVENTTELVSRPSISVLMNCPAEFANSDQAKGTIKDSSSSLTIDAGSKVRVIPLQYKDGKLLLDISITSSSFNNRPDTAKGIAQQILSLLKSKVSSTVNVVPGQTFMVACMYADVDVSSSQGVPLLKNLPLIQYFTSNSSDTKDRRVFVYLITPHLDNCPPPPQVSRVKRAQDMNRKLVKKGILEVMVEKPSLFYIMNYLEKTPMFFDFRSGDLQPMFFEQTTLSLIERINQFVNTVF